MPPRIPIETSARHIHITKEDFEALFGEGKELTFVKELSQPGQYVAAEKLAVIGPRGEFERVSILGPFRKETQVEIYVTDPRKLGIPSVIRQSGDTEGTPGCILRAGDKEITLDKGVIVAKRHIHMRPVDALQYNVKDNENVFVITKSYERNLIYADVVVRVSPSFRLAMHVDTDEANAFAGDADPYGVIVKIFDTESYSVDKWMEEVLRGINRIQKKLRGQLNERLKKYSIHVRLTPTTAVCFRRTHRSKDFAVFAVNKHLQFEMSDIEYYTFLIYFC